ncbi:hypothetical protein D3C77_567980 [compost metagenome]
MVQVFIRFDHPPYQRRVARPDHRAIRGIDVGQEHVRQVRDMVEELAAGVAARLRVDVREALVEPGVEQFAHGSDIGNGHMAHFSQGNGLNELRREQCVTFNTFVDHEAAGNQAKPYGHR